MAVGFQNGFDGPPPHRAQDGGHFVTRMAKVLKLTEAQQEQIKAVLASEREQVQPLREKGHDLRQQLMQAGEAITFDEAAVRALATSQAQIEAEMIVARTRTHNRINALLTAEQRELQKRLRPEPDRQPPAPGPGIGEF